MPTVECSFLLKAAKRQSAYYREEGIDTPANGEKDASGVQALTS